MNFNIVMNKINPQMWDKAKLELNLNEIDLSDETLFKNFDQSIDKFNHYSDHQLEFQRENDNIIIKLKNKDDSNIETNLESFMVFSLLIKIILSSLEETINRKFEIIGMGDLPTVYIKKVKN